MKTYIHLYFMRPTWPILFWTKCCGCKKEFRREWVWVTRMISEIHGIDDYEYLCKNCASTYFKAHKVFTKLYKERNK